MSVHLVLVFKNKSVEKNDLQPQKKHKPNKAFNNAKIMNSKNEVSNACIVLLVT